LDLGKVASKEKKEETEWFAAPHEIDHKFQTAEDRPTKLLPLIFTGLVTMPLAVWVLQILRKIDIQLPSGPTEFLFFAIFQGSLAAILVLNFLYWVQFNIFQALFFLFVLGVVCIFAGNKALSLRYRRRVGVEKEKAS